MNKKTLPNGLRLITVPLKNTKVATVLVLVKTGSKYEEKSVSGISHFLEHMFFKGTKKRTTPLRVVEEIDKIGGTQNAFTTEEYTGYYAKVKSSHIEIAVEYLSDIYLNSLFKEKEIEKEKGVIIEELNMIQDSPMTYCQFLFQNLLYKDQPAGWDVGGSKESVSGIKKKDIVDYWRKHYIAENTVVVVAGKVNKVKIEKIIRKYFSKIKNGTPQKKPLVLENQKKPEVLSFYKETDQTHFCLGARSFNIFHKYRYKQKVLSALLGGMMSSRLFVKLRDELGLAYYVATSVESNPDTGYLVTQAGVENKKVKEAVSAIMKEYKKLTRELVNPKELKKAKECIKGRTSIILESSDALSSFYGIAELLEGKTLSLEEFFHLIDKVTANDVKEIAKEIFKPENMNLAVVGPHKKEKVFRNLLH